VPGYTVFVSAPVFKQLSSFTPDERAEIRRLLRIIQFDPSVDGIHKIIAARPPAIFTAYVSPRFWIFYRVRVNLISIDLIERATKRFPVPW
jgi:hypothetical protein